MPNSNDVFKTKRGAEQSAAWAASEAREQGYKVSGSARSGYYSVGEHECIEITECSEPDCLEGVEE
jgi:hypothetical protein